MTSSAPSISTRTAPSGWKASRSTPGSRLGGEHFLPEIKCQQERIGRDALDAFRAKVERHSEKTLGLFVGINGFKPTAVNLHTGNHSPMILMDGADLYAALDDRIDLRDLLSRKRRASSITGRVLLTLSETLAGST